MPVYYARPANVQNPPVILVAMEIFGLHEYIKDVTRRLAKLGAFAIAPDYYFRKGEDLTKITEIPQAHADRQHQAGRRAPLRPRRHRGVGEVAGRRHQPPRHHGLLPRRPDGVGIRRPQQGPQGGRRVLRHRGGSARAKIALAEEPDRAGAGDEGAGARPLRRGRSGHSGSAGRRDEGRASRPRARPSSSRFIRARRTASTPTIAPATARTRPRTPGTRWSPGSRNTKCSPNRRLVLRPSAALRRRAFVWALRTRHAR